MAMLPTQQSEVSSSRMLVVWSTQTLALPMDVPQVSTPLAFEQLLARKYMKRKPECSMSLTLLRDDSFPDLPIAGANNALCLGVSWEAMLDGGGDSN